MQRERERERERKRVRERKSEYERAEQRLERVSCVLGMGGDALTITSPQRGKSPR